MGLVLKVAFVDIFFPKYHGIINFPEVLQYFPSYNQGPKSTTTNMPNITYARYFKYNTIKMIFEVGIFHNKMILNILPFRELTINYVSPFSFISKASVKIVK